MRHCTAPQPERCWGHQAAAPESQRSGDGQNQRDHLQPRYPPLMAHAEVPLDRAGEGQAKPGPRHGVALCLSGGGYRAALFHLGAARRLNELGLLGAVATVTSVSGGSIFAAHLARHLAVANGMWPPVAGVVPGWEAGVAGPVREMATRNLRAPAMLSRRRWATSWRDHALAAALAATGGGDMARLALRDLPRRPRFVFCATDLQFGDQWTFDTGAQRLGSSKAGFLSPLPSGWSLASAVAASCCVPYAFAPFRVKGLAGDLRGGSYQGADRRARAARIDLGDGGLYDNLGLEPVWDDHAVLFVSDCAPSYAGVQGTTRAWPALRPFVILLDQATNVRRRWLASEISGQTRPGRVVGDRGGPALWRRPHRPGLFRRFRGPLHFPGTRGPGRAQPGGGGGHREPRLPGGGQSDRPLFRRPRSRSPPAACPSPPRVDGRGPCPPCVGGQLESHFAGPKCAAATRRRPTGPVPVGTRMPGEDIIFTPLRFRNLTFKNRIVRSSLTGRFDNYDGSGTAPRVNWELKFARNGAGAIISALAPVEPRRREPPQQRIYR